MKNKLLSISKSRLLWTFIVFAGSFAMLCMFLNFPNFISDEDEIFVKGKAIADGFLLYRDIGSQHMPIMYYIAAVFAKLSVSSVLTFRFCFYGLTGMIWGLMFFVYSPHFGKKPLIIYPILYIFTLNQITFGYCVLSDGFQAIGMSILLFELLLFFKRRIITIANSLMISFAVLISFGSAFVSIFGIFFVALTVLAIEIYDAIKRKTKFWSFIVYLFKKYWLLVVIVALPFVLLIAYYILTGTLKDFYNWAYLINRKVYPKYMSGYGSGILSSMFGGIGKILGIFASTELTLPKLLITALLCFSAAYLLKAKLKPDSIIVTFGIILFIIACASRSISDFHGLPAIIILVCLTSLLFSNIMSRQKIQSNTLRITVVVMSMVIFGSAYFMELANLKKNHPGPLPPSETATTIMTITDSGEKVGFSTYDYDVLLSANVYPATLNGGSCPWLWEWCGDESMDELKANPPRVFIYDKNYNTWGYRITNYAGDVIEFIYDNYTPLNSIGLQNLFIRNDYLDDAITKLDESVVYQSEGIPDSTHLLTTGTELDRVVSFDENCQISSIDVFIDTYERANNSTLEIYITDNATGEKTLLLSSACDNLVDNSYNSFEFEPFDCEKGTEYTISVSSPDALDSNCIGIYTECDYNLDYNKDFNDNIKTDTLDPCLVLHK